MTRTQVALFCVLAALGPRVYGSDDTPGGKPVRKQRQRPVVEKNSHNTFTFDHLALRGKTDAPYVLEVGDGEYFQVRIMHTDPALFKYSIAATQDEAGPLTSNLTPDAKAILAHPDSWVSVTHRHDKHFNRYRVTISELVAQGAATTEAKQDANTKLQTMGLTPSFDVHDVRPTKILHPVAFDLWVTTRPEWKVSFSGGVAVSGLTDHKYYIKTDDTGKKTVEEDIDGRDQVRHDIVALANVYFDHQYFRSLMFGAGFGLGDNGGSTPRYYIGPTIVLGKNFIFSGGLTFGPVATLPSGQALHAAPTGDNVLNNLSSRYQHGYFASIAFGFLDRETEFRNGLTSSTTTGTGTPPGTLGETGGTGSPLAGTYQTDDNKDEKVEIATASGKMTLTLTVDADTATRFASELDNKSAIVLQEKDDSTYQSGSDVVTFTQVGDTITLEFKHGTATIVKATKKKTS